jgi:small-conductance mechanosensitive channel
VDEVKGLLERDLEPADEDDRYLVRRVNAVVDFVDGLREADPVLVEQPPLDALHTSLSNIKQALTQYLGNTDAKQFLQAAADQVPSVMATARQHFPWSPPDEAQRSTKAAATRYKNALDQEVGRLQAEVDSLRDELAAAQQQREAERDRSQQSLATLEERIESRGTVLDELQSRIEQQIQAAKASFDNEAEARQRVFDQAEAARVDADAKRIEDLMERAEAQRAEQASDAEALIESLLGYRDQAKALADETSRHAVAGEYGTWASHQARAAFWWTVATVVAGVATVGGLVLALKSAGDDSSQYIVSKLSISLVGLFIAAYTAHQASEHREEERTAKRLALDLAALQPFLEQIED